MDKNPMSLDVSMLEDIDTTIVNTIQILPKIAQVLLDVIPIRQFGIALSCSSTVQDQGAHSPALAAVIGLAGLMDVGDAIPPLLGGCDSRW